MVFLYLRQISLEQSKFLLILMKYVELIEVLFLAIVAFLPTLLLTLNLPSRVQYLLTLLCHLNLPSICPLLQRIDQLEYLSSIGAFR